MDILIFLNSFSTYKLHFQNKFKSLSFHFHKPLFPQSFSPNYVVISNYAKDSTKNSLKFKSKFLTFKQSLKFIKSFSQFLTQKFKHDFYTLCIFKQLSPIMQDSIFHNLVKHLDKFAISSI